MVRGGLTARQESPAVASLQRVEASGLTPLAVLQNLSATLLLNKRQVQRELAGLRKRESNGSQEI